MLHTTDFDSKPLLDSGMIALCKQNACPEERRGEERRGEQSRAEKDGRHPNIKDFDQFWKSYPKKVAKGEAEKAWTQTTKVRPMIDVLILSVEKAKKSNDWMKDGGQYIPHPASWLRDKRWLDESTQIQTRNIPDIDATLAERDKGKLTGAINV